MSTKECGCKEQIIQFDKNFINQKKSQILKRYNHLYDTLKLTSQIIHQTYQQIYKKQSQLSNLLKASQKQISKYFMTFAPLKCNPALFSDMKIYGGAKIAVNNNRLYIGTIVDGKRHGKGLIISQKGKIFEGQLINNQRNGLGVEIYENGNFYIGNFINNKRHGKGKMIWIIILSDSNEIDYQYYSGEWFEGEPHGEGIHSTQQYNYIGYFKHGVRHGKGIEFHKNKSMYEGMFQNGIKDGIGFYYKPQIEAYEGDFKSGEKSGYGKWYNLQTNQQYQGFFVDGKREGIGLYKRNNGFTYKGFFTDNQPTLNGQITQPFSKLNSGNNYNRLSTELLIHKSKDLDMKKVAPQSAQIPRISKINKIQQTINNKLNKKNSAKELQLNSKQKQKQIFNSKPKLHRKTSISSSKRLIQTRDCPEQQSQRKCKYRGCSCNIWPESGQKMKVNQSKLRRLYSSRKLLVKQLL